MIIALKRVFFEKPQLIFHLAAFFANQNSVDYPEKDLMVNGAGTLKLLEYALLIKSNGLSMPPPGVRFTEAPRPFR